MEYHVERRRRYAQGLRDLLTGPLFDDAEADGTGVAGVDLLQGTLERRSRGLEITSFDQRVGQVAVGKVSFRSLGFALQVVGAEEDLAPARAQQIDRHVQGHHA